MEIKRVYQASIGENFPEGLNFNTFFSSREDLEKWMENNGQSLDKWSVHDYPVEDFDEIAIDVINADGETINPMSATVRLNVELCISGYNKEQIKNILENLEIFSHEALDHWAEVVGDARIKYIEVD